MSLAPPDTVRKLQEALPAKAKRAPIYRLYALYDKVYRADVLSHAYFQTLVAAERRRNHVHDSAPGRASGFCAES